MNYYNDIKEKLIKNEVYANVKDYSKNRHTLNTYYEVGRILSEAGKHYGEGIIKEYSNKLTKELNKKYSTTTLKYMRQFYMLGKSQPVADQLTWSHYQELLPIKDDNERSYYINRCINNNLSKRDLRKIIRENEYERLPKITKEKLKNKEKLTLIENIKEPIIIKNNNLTNNISEYVLKEAILDDLDNFLKQLGDGYCYIENEYKIRLGDRYNYIDMLLFNIKYNCYVVLELKVTELKKEHISQTKFYMNYIDKNIKNITHDKTKGIIIVKENNNYVIKYLHDQNIKTVKYELI